MRSAGSKDERPMMKPKTRTPDERLDERTDIKESAAKFWSAPAERLAVIRILITAYALGFLLGYTPNILALGKLGAAQFAPVGPITLLDAPLSSEALLFLLIAAIGTGFLALLGAAYRCIGPLFALLLLFITSYRSSFGMIFHTENLLVFHALLLALYPSADAYSIDAKRRGRQKPHESRERLIYGAPLFLMSLLTVTSYALAGIAKLRYGGAAWLEGEVLLSHIAWDNLRKLELGSIYSPLGAYLCRFPAIFGPLAWLSLAFELFAPLALLGKRLSTLWVVGAISFHLGVALVMAIVFAYPLFGFAFLSFFAVERPAARVWARTFGRLNERPRVDRSARTI